MTATIQYRDVESAAETLAGVVRRTPVMTSGTLDERTGASVFLKCESFQRAGAFKFRGAYHALARHRERSPGQGAVTASSGNHAQAMALAGSLLGVPVTIVMPDDAPRVKLEATRGYLAQGAGEVVLYDRRQTSREAIAARLAEERNLATIPAFDHPDIVAGQGTAARELFEEVGELDLLLVCCGGGGLLAGSAISASALAPRCRVIGVEPALADDGARSLRSGRIERVHNPPTIADGARTASLGTLNFEIIQELAEDIVTVADETVVEAMRFLWERMKLIVEPTGALALAALVQGSVRWRPRDRIGITISGGNVDVEKAARLFRDNDPSSAPLLESWRVASTPTSAVSRDLPASSATDDR